MMNVRPTKREEFFNFRIVQRYANVLKLESTVRMIGVGDRKIENVGKMGIFGEGGFNNGADEGAGFRTPTRMD